ncbi:MAG: hypothetical protein JW888_07055 [Pirellulales bacterium]|nr:hypothetical protein [Pirellulales bacterium]
MKNVACRLFTDGRRLILLSAVVGVVFGPLVLCPSLRAAPPTGSPKGSSAAKSSSPKRNDPETLAAQRDAEEQLVALLDKNRIFLPAEYPKLRRIHARLFERTHRKEMTEALAGNYSGMMRWFNAHPNVAEEFFTAIDPKHDDVVGAVRLFEQLARQYYDRLPDYADAAIAVAVVWDKPRGRGVQDYRGQARRTKSILPKDRIGAVENFKYLLDTEEIMQGRARFLPWEFLVLVVNHRTPINERLWAVRNYLHKRVMIGKCYADVSYDTLMLETGSKTSRLNGQEYTLPNLRQFGGVCVIQADFASRVAKCLGVPAAYVGGTASSGVNHAWVMWVELLRVTQDGIQFQLKSQGRYRGDHYYVGHLADPHTGEPITDRQLELRLHTVGLSPQNSRHAALLMKSYPMICRRTPMDVAARLRFLNQVLRLSPGNEQAWLAVAQMSRDGQLTKRYRKIMTATLDNLFKTFALYPDFTWVVFDDLIAFEDRPTRRAQLYDRLVTLYIAAKRPDLACEAVLKFADYRVAERQHDDAIRMLANTIMAFPDEGRYVPKMLDKLEAVAKRVKGANVQVLEFYQALLPKVPRMRGNRPRPYCKKMYGRAIQRFTKAGLVQQAQFWQAELDKLEASKLDK